MLRNRVAASMVAMLVLLAACDEKSSVTEGRLDCSARSPVSPSTTSVRRPSPQPAIDDAIYAELGAILVKYYGAKYTAVYEFCSTNDDGTTTTGSLRWFKDGETRSRRDMEFSPGGRERFAITEIAIAGKREPRLAECSDNLGSYYSALFSFPQGEAFVEAYPELKGYFDLGETCINGELESHEDILTDGQLSGLMPVELENFNDAPRIYAANLSRATTTIAGREVTCFSYGDFGYSHENCFDADGVLIASGSGDSARMELTDLQQAVNDVDFLPPYPVVAAPDQCPGNTAWDRATPTNPGASSAAPDPGDYHDALTRYFNVRSKVTYEMCYHGGDGLPPTFDGPLTWTKDGTTRARFDLTELGGPETSYFASRTDQTVCTADASKYLRLHAGGDQLRRPFNQSLLQHTNVCFPDSEGLGGNTGHEYEFYILGRMFSVPDALAINTEDWEHTDPLFSGGTYQRMVAGQNATCYTHPYDREECYTDEGILVFARNGVRSSLEATSISTEVSEADFELLYELKREAP